LQAAHLSERATLVEETAHLTPESFLLLAEPEVHETAFLLTLAVVESCVGRASGVPPGTPEQATWLSLGCMRIRNS
jgi:hypothetical protein